MSFVNVMDMRPSRHAAYVPIAPFLLAELLHMPSTMKITNVAFDSLTGEIRLFVEDTSLPDTPEGVPLRALRPTVTTYHDDHGELIKQEWDWTYRE